MSSWGSEQAAGWETPHAAAGVGMEAAAGVGLGVGADDESRRESELGSEPGLALKAGTELASEPWRQQGSRS